MQNIFYFYQHLPLYIDPIAFTVGSFSVRWYAISYIAGFLTVYLVLMWRVKKGEWLGGISNFEFRISNEFQNQKSKIPNEIQNSKFKIQNLIADFLLVAFFVALVGGRIGYVLFYNWPYFLAHPLAIFWPYDSSGQFIGLYGMSYHGALLGVLLGGWLFARAKKTDFWQWADFVAPAVPPGYFFGRVGNFLNGELYGRITSSPFGMHFAGDQTVLRHPSQLYEAVLEGLLLFVILWTIRNRTWADGKLLAIYILGYGALRIFGEMFRQPDPQIGFVLGYLTLGQLLSLGMVIFAILILIFKKSEGGYVRMRI